MTCPITPSMISETDLANSYIQSGELSRGIPQLLAKEASSIDPNTKSLALPTDFPKGQISRFPVLILSRE